MSLISESSAAPRDKEAALERGTDIISDYQSVTFTQYQKSILQSDGYVFWVKTGVTETFDGSLHQAIQQVQNEDETIAINSMVFTSKQEIAAFNTVGTNTLWIGEWVTDNATLKVVFNQTAPIYKSAGIWHYSGDAVYPALESQLVNSASDLPAGPIVSNSLPIWLTLDSYTPVNPTLPGTLPIDTTLTPTVIPVYPSYLVSENLQPPYVVVHINPANTVPLSQAPLYVAANPSSGYPVATMSTTQLMRDTVELTLYGFNGQQAMQYLQSIMDYSVNTDDIGFCNSPVIQDEKRTQSELTVIAMKKRIVIMASYYLSVADIAARNVILAASDPALTLQ